MALDDLTIRTARESDDRALLQLSRTTWSRLSDVTPMPAEDGTTFDERHLPDQFLVAELDGRIVGYIRQVPPTTLAVNQHIRQIQGLSVLPEARGKGIADALIEAACEAARAAGAVRMTLHVLGRNAPARRLYDRCGFVLDGTLPGEFLLDGEYVDDVLMGRRLDG